MSTPEEPTCGDDEPVSDDEWLAERERLAEAATKGPWVYDDGVRGGSGPDDYPWEEHGGRMLASKVAGHDIIIDEHGFDLDADGAFIADARTAVPALVAAVRRLREKIDRLRGILKATAQATSAQLGAALGAVDGEHERLRAENAALQAALRRIEP